MKKNYKNKEMKTDVEEKPQPKKTEGEPFFYPDLGKSIIATSRAEADKEYKKLTNK